ncbi:hypothetical protein KI659_16920 [Litoribacter alkaliphilus]|uniref:Uncharacterized protein n=1 Tax=Litoribacter ruber TaxID=702568 RepID=A0AAP2CL30_9BACT|nr:hypothetical protein [Litoribacter alkaliphilus]MBS9525704.1 hypothetical protein [Litoribacter alkaliphilus]
MYKEIKNRIESPTPPFFKKLQKGGLILIAVGTAIMSAPVAIPLAIVNLGGYILTAGTIITAVSQVAKEDK